MSPVWSVTDSVNLTSPARFWEVFWIDATNNETAEQSVKDIAEIPAARQSGVQGSVESVLLWLSYSAKENWLLVFDNASDPDMLSKFSPRGSHGNLLITSRNPEMRRTVHPKAWEEVEKMEVQEAISLLLKAACLDESAESLRHASQPVVAELCCLPLAVDQAGAYIASGLCELGEYLGKYQQHHHDLLAHPSFRGASNYGQAVYGTWDLSFQAIAARAAGQENIKNVQAAKSAILLLQIFSSLHHESISKEIFQRAAANLHTDRNAKQIKLFQKVLSSISSGRKQRRHVSGAFSNFHATLMQIDKEGKWDDAWLREGTAILLSFSLIKSLESNIYSTHPLVHLWSWDRLSRVDQQISCLMTRRMLCHSITWPRTAEDYRYCKSLIPHIFKNEGYCRTMNITKQMIDDEKGILEENHLGLVYFVNSYYKEAAKHYMDARQMCDRMLGAWHPRTLEMMWGLALAYVRLGHFQEAEQLQVQVRKEEEKAHGPEHPDTLTCIAGLAGTYRHQGKLDEAESLEVQVMEVRKRILGPEHPHTLSSIANLTATYRKQGKVDKAESLQVQVMEVRKRILVPEHPDTLASIWQPHSKINRSRTKQGA